MVGWSEEEIKERNRQLSRLMDSRKEIFVEAKQGYRKELREEVLFLKSGLASKSDKEATLRRIRQLEALTGVNLGDYNKTDFGGRFLQESANEL